MILELYIDQKSNKIYNESGEIVGEQRGKECTLAPFDDATFVESGYPEGWKLDAEEWPIYYKKDILDAARERQYYECYFGLYIVPLSNDLRINRCGIFLKDTFYQSIKDHKTFVLCLKEKE